MSELDDIRAFVEVVDSGGFGRAARRLELSKSIVSRRVTRLEAGLGAVLLSRTTRGVTLTEAGAEYKARAQRVLSDLEAAREAVAQSGDEIVGSLRVSLPLSFGLKHVAPLLAGLAVGWPRLRIEACYSDRFVDLIAERFDVAIRIGMLEDSTLVARRIAPIRRVPVASPAYLARRGRPATPDDLSRHEALIYTGARSSTLWRFRDGRRWISIRPEGGFRSDSGEALLQGAVAGLGITVVPTFLLSGQIEDGTLEGVLVDYPMQEGGLFVVRPPGAHVPGKVRAFTDMIVERFGGEPYWDACRAAMQRREAVGDVAASTGR